MQCVTRIPGRATEKQRAGLSGYERLQGRGLDPRNEPLPLHFRLGVAGVPLAECLQFVREIGLEPG
jgi:hypothetical protein